MTTVAEKRAESFALELMRGRCIPWRRGTSRGLVQDVLSKYGCLLIEDSGHPVRYRADERGERGSLP